MAVLETFFCGEYAQSGFVDRGHGDSLMSMTRNRPYDRLALVSACVIAGTLTTVILAWALAVWRAPLVDYQAAMQVDLAGVQRVSRIGERTIIERGRGWPRIEVETGVPLAAMSRPFDQRLPIRPVMPGFLIDVIWWSVLWLLTMMAVLSLRGKVRGRRDLCPRCAYDCSALTTCPECGYAIRKRARG